MEILGWAFLLLITISASATWFGINIVVGVYSKTKKNKYTTFIVSTIIVSCLWYLTINYSPFSIVLN